MKPSTAPSSVVLCEEDLNNARSIMSCGGLIRAGHDGDRIVTMEDLWTSANEQKGSAVGDGTEQAVVDPPTARYVAFYFSAHWCPPCRSFTPQLVQTYNHLRSQAPQRDF